MSVLPSRALAGLQLMLSEEGKNHVDVGEHADRVGSTSKAIAEAAGMSADEVETLVLASRFHDVGKMKISDDILRKPGRLDPDERAVMERHASIGADMLSRIPGLPQMMLDVARYHHERHDGWGYERLAGEDVPYPARIVAIADCHDALLSPRAYKPALREGDVLMIMAMDVPSPGFGRRAFDPVLLRLFIAQRLMDHTLEATDEQLETLGAFAGSDPALDLDPEQRALVEFAADGSRRIFEVEDGERRQTRSLSLSGEQVDAELDYAPARLHA